MPRTIPRRAAARRSSTRGSARRKLAAAAAPAERAPEAASPVRIARVAKGKKPQYFSDPAIDKLLWMTLTLMEELSVTRDRLDTVERLLDKRKLLKRDQVERYVPDAVAAAERNAHRGAYVDRVLRIVQVELEELTGKDMPKTQDEVVAAVAT